MNIKLLNLLLGRSELATQVSVSTGLYVETRAKGGVQRSLKLTTKWCLKQVEIIVYKCRSMPEAKSFYEGFTSF